MKLEEQLQDRTVCLGLCRTWDTTPNQSRAQWFAKKTEDPFFILIHPRKFLSYVGFYSSSSLDHATNTFQGMASEVQLAHFSSGVTSSWFPIDMVHQGWEVKLSAEQPGVLDVCYSATLATILTYGHILPVAHLLCALAAARRYNKISFYTWVENYY